MSAHAPAPWKVDAGDERHPGVYLHLRDADGKAVAIVYGATLEQRSANAQILEAGPELLEALREALAVVADYLSYRHDGDPWTEDARLMGEMEINDYAKDGRMDRARAAIAKAEGGQP